VLEFDVETWKRAIEVFDIREPMIPTRPPVADKDKYPSFKREKLKTERMQEGADHENFEMDDEDEEE